MILNSFVHLWESVIIEQKKVLRFEKDVVTLQR